jgi:sacsin
VNLLLVKNTTMHGVFWGSYMQHDYKQLAGGMREVLGWLGQGRLQLEVSHRCVGGGRVALLA